MHKKKLKKLTLNTETLRHLSGAQLEAVAGQATTLCTATRVCSGCKPCA